MEENKMFEQEITIFDLLYECPCMTVNKEIMECLVNEVKKHDGLTLDVSKINDNKYVVELWMEDEE